jgi:Asp-tRNA(Asn)/Glu-tRNA(Gln) amidotransferase A subunit family amidase
MLIEMDVIIDISAGLPSISVPVGAQRVGEVSLPIGMQLIAAPYTEHVLLRVSKVIESCANCPLPEL